MTASREDPAGAAHPSGRGRATAQRRPVGGPEIRVFPSADAAFVEHARLIAATERHSDAAGLQARLRRFYPRAIARARELSGEPDVWYVYRDGMWAAAAAPVWWQEPHVGHLEVSLDGGWFLDADGIARDILGLASSDLGVTHFTDLLAPGTVQDAEALYRIVGSGTPFDGTVVIRPLGGGPMAVDLHAEQAGDRLIGAIRVATDIPPIEASTVSRSVRLDCRPASDEAFARYAGALLDRMPVPTLEGLALRLRRFYPHADIRAEGDTWIVDREPPADGPAARPEWWHDPGLPRVAFDRRGLITEANAEARALLGSPLVGHHWHELVTAGTSDAVDAVIDVIREAGGAISRFRMPDARGRLVEFDCYTTVDREADRLTSILRVAR
jgi:PAS domain-containing protein